MSDSSHPIVAAHTIVKRLHNCIVVQKSVAHVILVRTKFAINQPSYHTHTRAHEENPTVHTIHPYFEEFKNNCQKILISKMLHCLCVLRLIDTIPIVFAWKESGVHDELFSAAFGGNSLVTKMSMPINQHQNTPNEWISLK